MLKRVMLIASIVFWFFMAAFLLIDTPHNPSLIEVLGRQYSSIIIISAVLLPIIVFPLTLLFVALVKKLRGKDLASPRAKRIIITVLTALLGLFLLIPPG
ncbi:MAG: hypothetical protein NT066_05565, partial [Candidatus Omnitrophica bacterium]|nr:hypothetical protein [Candidatus Omnitrophota bacterium]